MKQNGGNGKVTELILALVKKCLLNEEKIRSNTPLSPAEYTAILTIDPGEESSCRELSERMGLSPSRGSRIIYSLIKKRYFESNRSEHDRRKLQVSLARKGEEVRSMIDEKKEECEIKIVKQVTKEKRQQIMGVLKLLIEVL